MGFITRNKDKESVNNENERIERKGVEELIECVQLLSTQLDLLLEKVTERDEIIDTLEKANDEYKITINQLTSDIERYDEDVNKKNDEIVDLCSVIKDQQDKIEQRELKIKKLEEEFENLSIEMDELKHDKELVEEERNELERKIQKITGVIKE